MQSLLFIMPLHLFEGVFLCKNFNKPLICRNKTLYLSYNNYKQTTMINTLSDLAMLKQKIMSGESKAPKKKEKPKKEWEILRYTLTCFRASKNTFESLSLNVIYEYKGEERRYPIFARMEEESLKSFCKAFNFGKGVWNHKKISEKDYFNYSKIFGYNMTKEAVEGSIKCAIKNGIKN